MLWLYCLPGRIIAEVGYLWPGRNELWASGRRRESRFAHFLLSTVVWAVVGLFVTGHFTSSGRQNPPPPNVSTNDTPLASVVSEPDATGLVPTTEHAPKSLPTTNSDAVEPSPAPKDEKQSSILDQIISNPRSIAEVSAAIEDAANSTGPQRWHASKLSGYAVAGQPAVSGCKQVRVSIDEAPDASIDLLKVCPN